MVRRRATKAGVVEKIGNHSFCGTGITTFLLNDPPLGRPGSTTGGAIRSPRTRWSAYGSSRASARVAPFVVSIDSMSRQTTTVGVPSHLMGLAGGKAGVWRGVSLTLVVFALAIKVLVPPGFMVASDTSAFPLVICTGHGPLVLGGHGDQKGPSHKTSDAPCPFAGSSTPPTPTVTATVAEPLETPVEQVVGATSADQTPGRGLAAPPPQSRAPPAFPDMT